MGRPRKVEKLQALGPLGGASARLQLLKRAGLSDEARADILRSFITQARDALENAMSPLNPLQPDWHARMNAGAKLLNLIEALPPKAAGSGSQSGPQVIVVNELPAWGREPRPATAKVIEALPQPSSAESSPSPAESG